MKVWTALGSKLKNDTLILPSRKKQVIKLFIDTKLFFSHNLAIDLFQDSEAILILERPILSQKFDYF